MVVSPANRSHMELIFEVRTMAHLNEELLHAWLRVSTSIVNSRIVSELSYNETLVCNALYRNRLEQGDRPLTATDLCGMTNMLKSQMNRTLNLLEVKGLITRERSTEDKRQVFVWFDPEKADAYQAQHSRILKLLDGIIEELGVEQAEEVRLSLIRIADIADGILKNK